jgi:hypothetical protein
MVFLKCEGLHNMTRLRSEDYVMDGMDSRTHWALYEMSLNEEVVLDEMSLNEEVVLDVMNLNEEVVLDVMNLSENDLAQLVLIKRLELVLQIPMRATNLQ